MAYTKQQLALKKAALVKAMAECLGVVTIACKQAGVDRGTYYAWMKSDAEFKSAIDDIAEVTLDFAENKLHKLMEKGDTAATIFYLKTKGKKRGYVERTEQVFPDSIIDITFTPREAEH
jgi:hypothetical protein